MGCGVCWEEVGWRRNRGGRLRGFHDEYECKGQRETGGYDIFLGTLGRFVIVRLLGLRRPLPSAGKVALKGIRCSSGSGLLW